MTQPGVPFSISLEETRVDAALRLALADLALRRAESGRRLGA
jgi:hypothetical protein